MHSVTITKKHCIGNSYMDGNDCPLYRAIREQIPRFPLRTVGGSWLRLIDGTTVKILNVASELGFNKGWGCYMMDEIREGKIDSFTVNFE